MSFNLRNIREISNDPLTKFVNELAKKLSKAQTENSIDQLEDKEDIYSDGQDVESVVKYHSLNSQNQFFGATEYFPPFEPDGIINTIWVRGINQGNNMQDFSTFGNVPEIQGDPLLMDGTPFDSGIHTAGVKSTCLRFNRPTSTLENEEHISVPHSEDISLFGTTTGISYFIRFRVSDIANQAGYARTLFEKIDDSTPTNGITVHIGSDGRLYSRITRGGVEYNWRTATSTIAVDTVYDVWITLKQSDKTVHIYVNNVDKSLTDPGSATQWHSTLTDRDLYLFHRGGTSTNGHVYGDLYDFRIYKEKIVSAAEVGYMYTNKWTISNIPLGQVAVSNYFSATGPATIDSFTSGSFSPTSFSV